MASFRENSNFIKWINTLYKDSFAKIMNNGWVSDPITLQRGLRQGCPLSPYLFIMIAEILANKIRVNNNIKGITINGNEHKLCQFADDTEITILFEENSLRELMLIMDNFEIISGLKVNSDKTEIMKIGSAKKSDKQLLPTHKFKWKYNIRTLGLG